MLSIKQLPNSERPYEKLEMYGEKALTNAELLAIIIKTGTKEETAIGLAQQILKLNTGTAEISIFRPSVWKVSRNMPVLRRRLRS